MFLLWWHSWIENREKSLCVKLFPLEKKKKKKTNPQHFNHRILGTASGGLQSLLQEQNANFSFVFKH